MGTVSVLELVWSVLAVAGIIICGRGWGIQSRNKARLVKSKLNGVRMLAATESVRQERMATLQQVAFLIVGMVAMHNPPNPASANPAWTSFIIGVCLIFAAAAGTYKSLKRQSLQARLEETIRAQDQRLTDQDQRLTDLENYDTVGMHQI